MHADVLAAARALGVDPGALRAEGQNSAYGGAVAGSGEGVTRFRVARVTPRKAGLFVAVWRRGESGSTEPFSVVDQDRLVIVTREASHLGAFVFPAHDLAEHGVVSVRGSGGKRGFRVYPPWSGPLNAQAGLTRSWQLPHYSDLA